MMDEVPEQPCRSPAEDSRELSDINKSCGPHVFGLEVEEDSLRMELLVRAKNRMRCDCVHYAGPELRASMIAWLEQMLTDLGITT